jgi:hypothetical protein
MDAVRARRGTSTPSIMDGAQARGGIKEVTMSKNIVYQRFGKRGDPRKGRISRGLISYGAPWLIEYQIQRFCLFSKNIFDGNP